MESKSKEKTCPEELAFSGKKYTRKTEKHLLQCELKVGKLVEEQILYSSVMWNFSWNWKLG